MHKTRVENPLRIFRSDWYTRKNRHRDHAHMYMSIHWRNARVRGPTRHEIARTRGRIRAKARTRKGMRMRAQEGTGRHRKGMQAQARVLAKKYTRGQKSTRAGKKAHARAKKHTRGQKSTRAGKKAHAREKRHTRGKKACASAQKGNISSRERFLNIDFRYIHNLHTAVKVTF